MIFLINFHIFNFLQITGKILAFSKIGDELFHISLSFFLAHLFNAMADLVSICCCKDIIVLGKSHFWDFVALACFSVSSNKEDDGITNHFPIVFFIFSLETVDFDN